MEHVPSISDVQPNPAPFHKKTGISLLTIAADPVQSFSFADMAELADAQASGACGLKRP
jgi:hypothetical protein